MKLSGRDLNFLFGLLMLFFCCIVLNLLCTLLVIQKCFDVELALQGWL